jgi:protein-S-isoprenylcysteine O-methyltransferase Ste14
MIERLLPLLGALALVGIVCWRAWLQSRRHGSFGIVLFRSQRLGENLRDGLAVALFALLVGQAVVWARAPEALRPWGADHSARVIWEALGAVLLLLGLGLLVTAQLHLGASWRIGVDEGARPGLVTTGLYRFCRNPIFLALLLTWAGYTLLLPTTLSLLLLIGGFIGIRQQVLLEEAYLMRTYGGAYREYAGRVGRFVPGIGKLG